MTMTLPELRAAIRKAQDSQTLSELLPSLWDVLDADDQTDTPFAVAQTVYDAQVATAQEYRPLDPETERHVMAWLRKNWNADSVNFVDVLTAILVNIASDEARVFLDERLAEATNSRVRALLETRIKDRADHTKKETPEADPDEEPVSS